jgi:uncharacterized protein DUF6966
MSDPAPPVANEPSAVQPAVSVAATRTTLSAKLSPLICKGLFSSPTRLVGAYEDECILLTHAWPSLSDTTTWTLRQAPHSANSRHYYVVAFETPPPKIGPGMPVPDWTFVLDRATIALSLYFGKLFESHGLVEGGGMFHVPEMQPPFTPYPHFPPFNDDPRVDVGSELNFAICSWLTRWLTSNTDAMRAVNSAGKYYLRALRSYGHDTTSAYVDLVMAGEILSDKHDMREEELYDDELLAVLRGLSERDAKLIKKRLFQVRRRFALGLRSLLNEKFFTRTEAKGPHAERTRLRFADIEKRLKAAYDVRSQYVHTGRTFGAHPDSTLGWCNEIQIGRPRTGSDKLDEALEWAPTFLGLERVIRFGLLRMAHKEIGSLHADLENDRVGTARSRASQGGSLAHAVRHVASRRSGLKRAAGPDGKRFKNALRTASERSRLAVCGRVAAGQAGTMRKRPVTNFHQRFGVLLTLMAELAIRLREADEDRWAEWVEAARRRVAGGDRYGLDHLLGGFGGMGSLNDISASAEIQQLCVRCWTLARETQRALDR